MGLYTMPDLKRRAGTLSKSLAGSNLRKLSNAIGTFDIFLSQRRLDAEIVQVLYEDLSRMGYSVYVDWISDPGSDRVQVNKSTAELLRKRLREAKCLLYVATAGAPDSKWMPWELGFKDGVSQRVAILPILDTESNTSRYRGVEYLGLYPYVVKANNNSTPPVPKLWVHDDEVSYVVFDDWLKNGTKPYARK